jgi:hypothetical protein
MRKCVNCIHSEKMQTSENNTTRTQKRAGGWIENCAQHQNTQFARLKTCAQQEVTPMTTEFHAKHKYSYVPSRCTTKKLLFLHHKHCKRVDGAKIQRYSTAERQRQASVLRTKEARCKFATVCTWNLVEQRETSSVGFHAPVATLLRTDEAMITVDD